ncbi:MAG: glycosyltransferase family A protein [Verrucomicrobiota bacterium]
MSDSIQYSVVIATKARGSFLIDTVNDLLSQSRRPEKIVIIDSIEDPSGEPTIERLPVDRALVEYHSTAIESAAMQRNYGAEFVDTSLICFLDDDVRLPKNHFEQLLKSWEISENVVAMSARIDGLSHRRPEALLKAYYRFQAGYAHSDYGAKVIGPAINFVPTYDGGESMISSEWLNSTCLLVRTEVFRKEWFPDFEGYSWGEDVHLTTRLRQYGSLYFENTSTYTHLSPSDSGKRDLRKMAHMQFTNQYRISVDCLGRDSAWALRRLWIHLNFNLISMIRNGNSSWLAFYQGGKIALSEVSK